MEQLQTNPPASKQRKKYKNIVSKSGILIVLILYAVLLFFPLYIVLITSFTSVEEITSTTSFVWFPKSFSFSSYINIFTKDIYAESLGAPTFIIGFWNTMWMTLIPLIVGLAVSGLSAFAFAKIKFPGREKLFRFAFILSTVPLGALSVISYTFFSILGWAGTPLPIIVPGLFGSMTTVFFLKMYYEGIPDSVIEAARIDGLSTVGTFIRIVFPLALPAFIAQFIFGFVGRYNNYLLPLLYLNGDMKYITLQLFLAQIRDIFPGVGQESIHCAAAVLGMLPLIIIYAFLQRLFIEGISVGSVKG